MDKNNSILPITKLEVDEQIKIFLNNISNYETKQFFEDVITSCEIKTFMNPNTIENFKVNAMVNEGITTVNKDCETAIYSQMIDYFITPKLLSTELEYYVLTKDGWRSCSTIELKDWSLFIQLILPATKLGVRNTQLILSNFLKYIKISKSRHAIIQLKNKYIQNGKIMDGYYHSSLPLIKIDREITENTKCDTAMDLISHLCNYDDKIKDWFIDQIASALILREDFKAKNGQLVRLYGPSGKNGKSTFNKFLKKVFGVENVFSTKINKLNSDNKYDVKGVVNSLFVVDEDADESFYKSDISSVLKTLVTGEKMSVREIYGKPTQCVPICKIIIASNHPFKSDDKTGGIHRRITEIKTSNELKRKNEWFDTLFSEKECQAFFNLCIKKMEALMNDFYKGDIIETPTKILNAKKKLAKENNNVLEFIEIFSKDIENYSVAEVRKNYELWCMDNDLNPLGKTKFNETIEVEMGLVREPRKGNTLKGDAYDRGLLDSQYLVRAWVKEKIE